MTQYLKISSFVDLLIACVFCLRSVKMTMHAVLFSLDSDSDFGRGLQLVGGGGSSSLCALSSLSLCSSDFSVEHLALRRSRGWGSVTFDEWIHLWLTLLFIWLFNLDFLSLSIHLSFPNFSFFHPLQNHFFLFFWPLLLA